MEFTTELSAFQGAIMSADNVHPFSRITSKGGNEEKIQFIIKTLLKFLKGTDFFKDGIIESIATLRKFALYIVFNADLTILEEFVDKEEMDVFIWTTPIIPTCLMCELFWNLHMESFVYEFIAFSFPPLSLEFAGAFLDHFKYFNPTECLNKLRKLTTACYTAICRFNFFEYKQYHCNKTLTNAFTHFKKSVKYFIEPPNSHKLNSLSEDELYKYQGNCLYSAFHCVYDCSIQYTSKQERTPNGVDNIYKLTYLKGSVKGEFPSYNITDNPKEILELLDNCHIVLLDALKKLFMDIVTVNTFCAWDEFEENGKTMQQTIGELCYKLRIQLLNISCLSDHPIVSMIQQIAREPVGIKDLIHSLDTETIIKNINENNDEKKNWLHALIDKQQLCNHTNLLEVIDANLVNYNEEDCYKLYQILSTSSDNKDITNDLSIKVFQCCSITDKYKILNDTFINNCFVNMKETAEFNNMLTVIFNKLIVSPSTGFTDILMLFLQSPRKVYLKIFSLAIENSQQTDIMLRAMNLLESFSNYHYDAEIESCIIKVIQNTIDLLETEVKQNNFVQFVHGLKEINVIQGSELLMLIIMPNIHKSLLSKNINNIHIQIRLLVDVYVLEEIVEYRAPMLAMLSQVISIARWQIDTFTPVAPDTLQLVLLLQKSLVTTYNNSIPENESKWLKSKVRNLQPLNMYYYRHLWNPPGSNFLQVISGKNVNKETSTDDLTILLTQILCSCTQQEWCDMWDSLADFNETSILNMFHQAISVIVMAESSHRTNNTRQCLLYCYRNLIHIIRYKYIKEPLSDDQILTVIKIITTIPILKEGQLDEIESLLLPLFSYLSERRKDYTIDLSKCIELKQKNLEDLVSRVFLNKENQL